MPRKLPPKSDEKPQFERFIETATQISAAETDEGLADTVRKIATSKHPPLPAADAKKRQKRI
jgi:hypothetical protein